MKIKKAVILAGGIGTRFLPITKAVPKVLLPIVDKPILHYLIEEAVNSGVEELLLIISPNKDVIKEYFNRNYELEKKLEQKGKFEELEMVKRISSLAKISFVYQDKPLGTGHAISLAKEFTKDEPFAIMYGDDLIESDIPALKQLIEIYNRYNCNVIGVKEVEIDQVSKYGIIDYKNKNTKEIKGLVEKPNINNTPSTSAGLGRYIVKPEIYDELKKISNVNGEYLFTDAMLNLMKYQLFYACEYKGSYFDLGSKFGYLKANIELGLKHKDVKDDLIEYLKNNVKI